MVDFDSVIEELIELSPNVAEYMSSMRYTMLVDTVDSINQQLILNSCYNCIIEDLNDLGITFHVDIDEVISNHYDVKCIIWLSRFLRPNNLIEFIKLNSYLLDFIENEIDDIADNEVIIHLLKSIVIATGDQNVDNAYVFLFDKITSNDSFSVYLKRIGSLYRKFNTEEIEVIDGSIFKEFINYYKSCMLNIKNILHKSKEFYWYSHSMESYFDKYFMSNLLSNNSVLNGISKWYFHTLNMDTTFDNIEKLEKECKEAYKKYIMMSEDHALYYKVNELVPTKFMVVIIAITLLVENRITPFALDISYKKTYNTLNNINPELAVFFNEVWEKISEEIIAV